MYFIQPRHFNGLRVTSILRVVSIDNLYNPHNHNCMLIESLWHFLTETKYVSKSVSIEHNQLIKINFNLIYDVSIVVRDTL